ncbi:hypothetical protein TNCV_77401 [Trichonephila clavipes]|nr:hypothetical protein TNCV_77401 [Trichonephila clavipes]
MDASSMDQIMSSVFGDCSQLPPAHTQEPQLLDRVPSLFDESNDLISFLDHFETGLALEQQEAPMDLTMRRMKKKSFDLTWDKGVELRFFQVGRPPSHRVWEAYQPHTTDAYSLDLTDCPRVADVHEMVDVVGRLRNAPRRQRPLAHSGSPTLEAGFGKTRAALA